MAHVSYKLSGAFEGALAGGGDPVSSPLYVFGPFLRLLAGAGLAFISFGAGVWLAVFTVIVVSLLYRMVMKWVTDGSGGSGLNEDEFGAWAVKLNASITAIEYTLTFLVSVAALVTFLADRYHFLHDSYFGLELRSYAAIIVTVVIGFAVNLGPKLSARAFGPATLAVLILFWILIAATIFRYGLRFPEFHFAAFHLDNLNMTLKGYAKILAVMTGIEIFANLVAAYQGPAAARSRKAFGSLLIIMGTTSITMLIVGPAIMDLSDPFDTHVSVFTQTLDNLLPYPFHYIGTFVSVAVLFSAAGASAQGVQNLALGLRYRHYISAWFGEKNRFEVAARPVWVQVAISIFCFIIFGAYEETYLALYAAGVFVLLSLTSWAAVKRLGRECKAKMSLRKTGALIGGICAAVLTSSATLIIVEERFIEGIWIYLVLLPILYGILSYYRRRLGDPHRVEDRLGLTISSSVLPPSISDTMYAGVRFHNILVPLDQSPDSEFSLATAQSLCRHYNGSIHLLTVVPEKIEEKAGINISHAHDYLKDVASDMKGAGHGAKFFLKKGIPAREIAEYAAKNAIDAIVMTLETKPSRSPFAAADVTLDVIAQTTPPLFLIRPTASWQSIRTVFKKILIALDGSEISEQVLPFVQEIARKFGSEIYLVSVLEGFESDEFPLVLKAHLKNIAAQLKMRGIKTSYEIFEGSPALIIIQECLSYQADLIVMASHGRAGIERQDFVKLGSVAETVIKKNPCPVMLISARAPQS